MPVQRLKDFLDKNNIRYVIISHSRAYTTAAIGAITHIPGKELAKTVIVKIDGNLAMAVVPGSRHVDLRLLANALGAKDAVVVSEPEFESTFPDCELGAMPPFGVLYDLPVFVDERLREDEEIAFNAGSHRELVRMSYRDFERLANPRVFRMATRSAAERAHDEKLGATA